MHHICTSSIIRSQDKQIHQHGLKFNANSTDYHCITGNTIHIITITISLAMSNKTYYTSTLLHVHDSYLTKKTTAPTANSNSPFFTNHFRIINRRKYNYKSTNIQVVEGYLTCINSRWPALCIVDHIFYIRCFNK